MNVLHKIMFLLKGTIYNNPNDKRLFVYRNERHKWFGITINFGHPMAGWFWLFNAVLLLGFILLINVLDVSFDEISSYIIKHYLSEEIFIKEFSNYLKTSLEINK